MKFEDAYCKFEHRIMPIHEVTFIYAKDPTNFSCNYKNSFWCPECRIAQLAYNNAATPYFCTYPNVSHADGCSLRQDEMGSRQAKSFVDNANNREILTRQLDSLLHLLLSENAAESKRILSYSATRKPTVPLARAVTAAGRRFPHKRIDTPFREQDIDCYKFFYGDVNLTWEKSNTGCGYKILLRNIKTDKFLCRINVTANVYPHIPNSYKSLTPFNCKIVFLACMQKTPNNYLRTSLRWSEYIAIHRI